MSLDVRAKLAGLKPELIASLFRECTPRVGSGWRHWGATVNAMVAELAGRDRLEDIVPHRSFEKGVQSAAQRAVKAMLSQRREALRRLDDELAQLERPLGEHAETEA